MTFSHNNKNDTILERDGNDIDFTFYSDTFTFEDPDTMSFRMTQDELFEMMSEYFDAGQYADTFEYLSLPAIDALWNVLLYMHQRNIQL